ncbi:hypothetical protein NDU88_006097 [Pleurodeles waltl]|uniref:Uncharacterized protein n=1 Tax=Pleurodeles waltl TaxID=8319 RepID=A0AAV7RKJ9_PLEWA|nr:hypothetical protein NDU88_006097 [Pleurodeles waltl]
MRCRETNDQASRRRCATTRHLQVGDRAIIKDRRPGWKFCTPYDPAVWVVSRVAGTMVTAQRANKIVSQNISWFRKVTFEDPLTAEADLTCPHPEPEQDNLEPQDVRRGGPTDEPGVSRSPENAPPKTQDDGPRSQVRKYNLRPNPMPSQRLRDFA